MKGGRELDAELSAQVLDPEHAVVMRWSLALHTLHKPLRPPLMRTGRQRIHELGGMHMCISPADEHSGELPDGDRDGSMKKK